MTTGGTARDTEFWEGSRSRWHNGKEYRKPRTYVEYQRLAKYSYDRRNRPKRDWGRRVAATLSDNERHVIDNMSLEVGIRQSYLVRPGLTMYRVKKIQKSLRKRGLAGFGYLMTDDQFIAGRGYWLNDAGYWVQQAIRETQPDWQQTGFAVLT